MPHISMPPVSPPAAARPASARRATPHASGPRTAAARHLAAARRLSTERLLRLAAFLPTAERALLCAYLELRLGLGELAAIHGTSIHHMRRRIKRTRRRLADPLFARAAVYSLRLPVALRRIAREYWLENRSLRQIAADRGARLHEIRGQIQLARWLLLSMNAPHDSPQDAANESHTHDPLVGSEFHSLREA